jgi:hypothetical protein
MLLNLILAAFLALASPDPKLRISGHIFFGHEIKLRATVMVPVDRENREVGLEWDGDEGGYTSRQLDEYVDWTNHTFEIRLRPGEYQFRGVLKQSAGRIRYSAAQTVIVQSDRPEDGE